MQKVFLSAAIALAVAGSWAFYPKAPESAGYMMLISNPARGLNADINLTTITPSGARQEQTVRIKSSLLTSTAEDAIQRHQAELALLNTYTRDGWHVVSVTPALYTTEGTTQGFQTVYLLEKR